MKIFGSLIKIKSGRVLSKKCLRQTKFRFKPSKFHVKEVKPAPENCGELLAGVTVDDKEGETVVKEDVAPTEVVGLSILLSLTD